MRRLLICVTLFAVVLPWANVAVCSNLSLKESQILLEECLKVAETAHEKRAVIREFYGDTPELRSYILSMDASIKSEVREPRCGFIDSLVAYQVSLRLNKEMHRLYEIFASKPAHLNTEVHDTNFQVWYTTDDQNYPNDAVDKAYAEEVLDYYKKARAKEIDSWDYRPGKSKGQNKFQIWIYDMGSLGKCGEFEKNSGATGDDPRTYCVNKIMPDLDSSYDDSLLLSTCAHEYHHASQVAYIDPSSGYKLWILEASTPWMGYEVRKQYPSVNGLWSEAVYEDRYDYWQEHSD